MTIEGPALDTFNTRLCEEQLSLFASSWRLSFLRRWAAGENTGAACNPFATTWEDPLLEDPAAPWYNTFADKDRNILHVRNYRSFAAGLQATGLTIRQPQYYATIRLVLNKQQISQADRPRLISDIRTWGTTAFANQLADGWAPPEAKPVTDPEHIDELTNQLTVLMDQVDRLNAAVLARFASVNAAGVALLKGATLSAFALQRAADPDNIPWEADND